MSTNCSLENLKPKQEVLGKNSKTNYPELENENEAPKTWEWLSIHAENSKMKYPELETGEASNTPKATTQNSKTKYVPKERSTDTSKSKHPDSKRKNTKLEREVPTRKKVNDKANETRSKMDCEQFFS